MRDTLSDLRFYILDLTRMVRLAQQRRRLKAPTRPRKGKAASFAIAIGAGLFSPAYANAPIIDKHIHISDKVQAINYAKSVLNKTQFECLLHLYAKESAWDRTAYNPSGAYGIPQLKNSMIRNMSGVQQTKYGIKYNYHRYGSMCGALQHWKTHGWH